MIAGYFDNEIYDITELYIVNAALALWQKSVVLLVIQSVLLTFSDWDKNSGFFVILAAIGVYSVYGSISVRISLRRLETAAKKLSETKCRQFIRSLDIRRDILPAVREIFIPEKECDTVHTERLRLKPCSVF